MTQQSGVDDAAVHDPTTQPAQLGRIASERPDLRLAIAQHPAAYPALLDWLAEQGDPQVIAAVATRRATGGSSTQPSAQQSPMATRPVPAYEQPPAPTAQIQQPPAMPSSATNAPYGQAGAPYSSSPQQGYGAAYPPIQGGSTYTQQGGAAYPPQGGQTYGPEPGYAPAVQGNPFNASSAQYGAGGAVPKRNNTLIIVISAAVAVVVLIVVFLFGAVNRAVNNTDDSDGINGADSSEQSGGSDGSGGDGSKSQEFCDAFAELGSTGYQLFEGGSATSDDSQNMGPIFDKLAANSTGESQELYQYLSEVTAFNKKVADGETDFMSMPQAPEGLEENMITILQDDAKACGLEEQ